MHNKLIEEFLHLVDTTEDVYFAAYDIDSEKPVFVVHASIEAISVFEKLLAGYDADLFGGPPPVPAI